MDLIQPGDRVRIIREWKRGDVTSPEVFGSVGTVLEVYPRFVVVQWRHYRECFFHDEVRKVDKRKHGRAAA